MSDARAQTVERASPCRENPCQEKPCQEKPCQVCGACCAYSSNWPRFSTEDDADLDLIPSELVNAGGSGMRCEGDRCAALTGRIGEATACAIYAMRPEVCRTCMPGDVECTMARKKYGLPGLA